VLVVYFLQIIAVSANGMISTGQTDQVAILPDVFDGSGDFINWISHFESVAAINKWSDEEKLLWLNVRLTGKAHVALTRLSHVMQSSFVVIKEALLERFEPSCKSTLYKIKFEERKKLTCETWADLGDDLLVLASRAFPGLEDRAHEELALWKYLDQLSNPQVSLAVRQRRPRTIYEAVNSTTELESYLFQKPSYQCSLESNISEENQANPAACGIQIDIVRASQQLIEKIE